MRILLHFVPLLICEPDRFNPESEFSASSTGFCREAMEWRVAPGTI
jgi:hypothetical protein